MSERWLKLYTSLGRHPKWRLKLASDTDRVAYVLALMAAKEAGADGRFESREHLALVIGPAYADSIDPMIAAGLIDELPDTGELWMHDFEHRQSPIDPKGAERARRYRSKKGGDGGSNGTSPHVDRDVDKPSRRDATVTSRNRNAVTSRDANDAVTETSRVTVREMRVEREIEEPKVRVYEPRASDAFATVHDVLIASNVWTNPTKRMQSMVQSMVRDHGSAMVIRAVEAELPDGHRDLLARVGRRCRQWAKERDALYETKRSESEQRRAIAEERAIADAPLEAKERAADVRASLATWSAAFGRPGEA